MQTLEAVIFDFNGVIADDLEIHLGNFVELAKRHGSAATKADFLKILHSPTIQKMRLIVETGSDRKDTELLLKENSEMYAKSVAGKSVLFPRAEEVLEALAKHFPLALVSNVFRPKLEAAITAKAKKCFRFIITAEEIEHPKPAPDSLVLAAKRLGVKPENCAYVGDSELDMLAARGAGMVAIGVAKNGSIKKSLEEKGAHLIVSNISELPSAIALVEKFESG